MDTATNDGSPWTTDFSLPSWMGDMFSQSQQDSDDISIANTTFFRESSPRLMEDLNSRIAPMEAESYMMLEDFDLNYEEGVGLENSPKYMTAATQTSGQTNRKIKPVKHPGLVLKTPIAYEKDTDLNVIPIMKDGMAVCEKCGAMGVKHAFYTKERRFCSQACAREYADLERCTPELPLATINGLPLEEWGPKLLELKRRSKINTKEDLTSSNGATMEMKRTIKEESMSPLPFEVEPTLPEHFLQDSPEKKYVRKVRKGFQSKQLPSFNWKEYLDSPAFNAAPVTCFRHAPGVSMWDDVCVGVKVEVINTDVFENNGDISANLFWVATIMRVSGYYVLLRYEGFGMDASKDFWTNICCLKPVGSSALQGVPLIPPRTVESKYSDWKTYLHQRLTGARTLTNSFHLKLEEANTSRFRPGMRLEVVDKLRISQVKVATIRKIIGKRLHVCYEDSKDDDDGFWCHEDSPLIHPVGWAKQVGAYIKASTEYLNLLDLPGYEPDDATAEYFVDKGTTCCVPPDCQFAEGMKLEAIDPLNLSSICVATVMQVLRYNYIMIRIDSYDEDPTNSDWFCYHASSPCIFPAGFCAVNNIPLTPPKGYAAESFSWKDYLAQTGLETAPIAYFTRSIPHHGFCVGMHIEATDLMDPRLVCVATISRVVGRLLKVHFVGWDEEFDQWLDCESPDIYPVGWCFFVGYNLEGPPPSQQAPVDTAKGKSPKAKKKAVRKRKGNKGHTQETVIKPSLAQTQSVNNGLDPEVNSGSSRTMPVLKKHLNQVKTSIAQNSKPVVATTPATFQVPDSNGIVLSNDSEEEPAIPCVEQAILPEKIRKERTVTSYVHSMGTVTKLIPRLVDASGSNTDTGEVNPSEWNVFDVAQFLRVNDCGTYCDSFSRNKVDGTSLLTLTKDEIIALTGMKVGPSLKIFDLIQQLKMKTSSFGDKFKGMRMYRLADK